jgi:hypothetical protein
VDELIIGKADLLNVQDSHVSKGVSMQDILNTIEANLDVLITILLALIVLVIVYLVFMVRAVIEMLRYDVHGVLLTFAFLALIPLPPILIMGVMVLIIWHYHKKDILAGNRQSR